jgi:hypothetical protein
MKTDQGADAGRLEPRGMCTRYGVQPFAQAVPQRVDPHRLQRREDPRKAGEAAGHGQDVVVECAGMNESVRLGGVESLHQIAPPAECAETVSSPEILAEGRHVGLDAKETLQAGWR